MRVAFLTHNYPRAPDDIAGRFLELLATALVRRGTAVTVIAPSDGGMGGSEERDGVWIRRVRYAAASRETIAYRGTMASALRTPSGASAVLGLWRALRRAAREELAAGTDLIHAHWWVPAGWAAPPGAPTVLTCHGTDVALLRRYAAARAVARPVFARARVVTTVSSQLGAWIEAAVGRPIGADRIQPMPADTEIYPSGSVAGGGGAVVLARLTAQKRIGLALDAIADLHRRGRVLRLTLLGDGPERSALERRAAALGLDGLVTFGGAVAPAEVPARLAGADVMIFPAVAEGFGLVAAEAYMCGVPVVACEDGGGVLDIVPASGAGRRARPSGTALADAISDLLEDPAARDAAVARGGEWRDRLSPDVVAGACQRWYAEALDG